VEQGDEVRRLLRFFANRDHACFSSLSANCLAVYMDMFLQVMEIQEVPVMAYNAACARICGTGEKYQGRYFAV